MDLTKCCCVLFSFKADLPLEMGLILVHGAADGKFLILGEEKVRSGLQNGPGH